MSENRCPWTKHEKVLLQDLRSQNAKALIVDLTALFNEKNDRNRTREAIRSQLKAFRRLAREKGARVAMPYLSPYSIL